MLLKCCEYIPKSLSFALLSVVELILFMLRIAPGQFGHNLWATKIVSKRHVSGKCENGITNSISVAILL